MRKRLAMAAAAVVLAAWLSTPVQSQQDPGVGEGGSLPLQFYPGWPEGYCADTCDGLCC